MAVPLQSFICNFLGRLYHSCCPSNVFISEKLMGGSVEEIMRDSRDRAIDGGNWCEVLHAWGGGIVIP